MKKPLRIFLSACIIVLMGTHGAAAETELRYADSPNNCSECHSEQLDGPYERVSANSYRMNNHGRAGNARTDLKLGLGYELKASYTTTCMQCHKYKSPRPFKATHAKHKKYDCSWCHGFSRPERDLEMPGGSMQHASR